MKKRVNAIEKYEFKTKVIDRTLQAIALTSLLAAVSLSVYGVFFDKPKNKEDEVEENNCFDETPIIPAETTISEQEPVENNLDNTSYVNAENIDEQILIAPSTRSSYEELIANDLEFKEVRVVAEKSHVYEVPTGFKIDKNLNGEYIGVKTLNKIAGYEDFVYQFYPEEEGYIIKDHGAYFEIITMPKEFITYSVPDGYDLVEDEYGNYYGVKMVACPITKVLS